MSFGKTEKKRCELWILGAFMQLHINGLFSSLHARGGFYFVQTGLTGGLTIHILREFRWHLWYQTHKSKKNSRWKNIRKYLWYLSAIQLRKQTKHLETIIFRWHIANIRNKVDAHAKIITRLSVLRVFQLELIKNSFVFIIPRIFMYTHMFTLN